MKKILFFGYYFYPSNEIGAVRISELATRFAKKYKVTVVLKSKVDNLPVIDNLDYIFVYDFNNDNSKKNYLKRNKFKLKIPVIRNFFHHIKNIRNSYDYLKCFKNKYSKIPFNYDIVISSYGPLCNHLCGEFVKKCNKNIIFLADFRDPMNVPLVPKVLIPFMNYLQRRICSISDYIVSVSNGYEEMIVNKKNKHKSYVVTNGFPSFDNYKICRDKFSFLYVGSMYGGARKFDALFDTISELISTGCIYKNDVEIVYAGSDNYYFENQISKYNLNEVYKYAGILNRNKCLELEKRSYFLLLSTWNNKNYKGVIPGKLYEYLMAQSKIISICTGNLPNSEVGEIIKELNCGFSIEIDTSRNYIIDYLLTEYDFFKKGKYKYDVSVIEKYLYDNLALEYEKILSKEIK